MQQTVTRIRPQARCCSLCFSSSLTLEWLFLFKFRYLSQFKEFFIVSGLDSGLGMAGGFKYHKPHANNNSIFFEELIQPGSFCWLGCFILGASGSNQWPLLYTAAAAHLQKSTCCSRHQLCTPFAAQCLFPKSWCARVKNNKGTPYGSCSSHELHGPGITTNNVQLFFLPTLFCQTFAPSI